LVVVDVFAKKALSLDARRALGAALWEARDLYSRSVTPSHLLVALFYVDREIAGRLQCFGTSVKFVRKVLMTKNTRDNLQQIEPVISHPLEQLIDEAIARAKSLGSDRAYPCHLFRALLTDATWSVQVFELLTRFKIDIDQLRMTADLMVKVFEPPPVSNPMELALDDGVAPHATAEPPVRRVRHPSDYFNDSARRLFESAYRFAEEDGDDFIELSHVLRAFVAVEDPEVVALLEMSNLRQLFARIGLRVVWSMASVKNAESSDRILDFSKETFEILTIAFKESRLYSRELIEARDVLLAILSTHDVGHLLAGGEMSQVSELSKNVLQKFRQYRSRRSDTSIVEDDLENREIVVSKRTYSVLSFAKECATKSRSPMVLPAHLMLGILKEAELSETRFVQERQADLAELRQLLMRRQGFPANTECGDVEIAHFGAAACHILRAARSEARRLRIVTVDLHHLTLAFMRTNVDLLNELSEVAKFNVEALRKRVEFCMLMQHHQSLSTTSVILSLSSLDSEIVLDGEPTIAAFGKTVLGRRDIERMLSQRSEFLISLARDESRRLAQSEVTLETLAIALIEETSSFRPELFGELGVEPLEVRDKLRSASRKVSKRSAGWRDLNDHCWRVLTNAFAIARRWRSTKIEPEHIFIALANESDRLSQYIFDALDIEAGEVKQVLLAIIREQYQRDMLALEDSTASSAT
jgi:ATP-dependent Clp protease ATP-binding subunit ClpA